MRRQRFLAGLGAAGSLTACGGAGSTLGPLATPAPVGGGLGATLQTAQIPLVLDLTPQQSYLPSGTPMYFAVTGQIGSTGDIYYCGPNGFPYPIGDTAPTGGGPGQQYPSKMPPPALFALTSNTAIQQNYNTGAAVKNWLDLSWPLTPGVQNASFDLANINAANIPGFGAPTLPGQPSSAFSGRIWVSVGPLKLPFASSGPGALTTPSPTGFPGAYCLFDWIEFSWDGANFFADTTQVDQFGFELRLTLYGTPNAGSNMGQQGVLTQPRSTIINNFVTSAGPPGTPLTSLPPGFGGTSPGSVAVIAAPSISVPSGTPALYPPMFGYVRALSPKQTTSYQPSDVLLTYYDALIKSLYTTWTLTPIVVSITSQTPTSLNGPYTGLVLTYPGTTALVFFQGSYPTLNQLTTYLQSQGLLSTPPGGTTTSPVAGVLTAAPNGNTSFAIIGSMASGAAVPQNTGNVYITSYDIWQCANSLANGAANAKAVQNVIASAFNRGTLSAGQSSYSLDSTMCPTNPSTAYYQGNPSPSAPSFTPWNVWSYAWHKYNANGLAYGFAYDDNCNQSTSVNYNISSGKAVVTFAPFL